MPNAAEACEALVVTHAGRRVAASALQLVPMGFGFITGVVALDAATPLSVLLQSCTLRKVSCGVVTSCADKGMLLLCPRRSAAELGAEGGRLCVNSDLC